jgi:hypothetical protein
LIGWLDAELIEYFLVYPSNIDRICMKYDGYMFHSHSVNVRVITEIIGSLPAAEMATESFYNRGGFPCSEVKIEGMEH